ncbi:MAG TPA: aminoacyl-tRNA hydrolase [Chlamydiales bacterium]|nr:aminoacyl-tRNA hydrolase [Chlamydiales bacterium]
MEGEGAEKSSVYLIAGLGNPGLEYEGTRHNLGFDVVSQFAKKSKVLFERDRKLKGKVAKGQLGEIDFLLLKPSTYMNESGASVVAAICHFKVPLSHLLVVVDDVAIPLGEMRMRAQGSSGGHNGLKSIEAHLATSLFPRLRVGVGRDLEEDLADYVLSRFSDEEKKIIPGVLEKSVQSIEIWMEQGINRAMDFLSQK